MSECDDVNPNVRDICECTRAGMTLTQCNHRRALWGKPALTQLPGDGPHELAPPEVPAPYTTTEKIASFVAVSAKTIWRYVTLQPGLLDDASIEERLAVCRDCDQYADLSCRICGCSCNKEGRMKWMLRVAHENAECPLKKW
jgi:hypothetical protein